MPETTDIVAPFDPTAYTTITGAQLLQLIDGAAPVSDKGMVLVTTDPTPGVPDVPDASVTTKWQRYLWLRLSPSTTSFTVYAWNNIAGSYLNWTNISTGTIAADSIKGYMITNGTITADKLAGSIPTSALASGSTFLTSSSVFPSTGDITGTQSAGLTIQNDKVTNAMLKADATAGSPGAAVKADNIVDGEITVTKKIDKTGAKYQVISNPTAGNPAWATPPYIANGAGLANPAASADNGKAVVVLDGSLAGEAGTFGYAKHGVVGTLRNLVASQVTNTTVDIDADAVVLANTSGGSYLATGVNLTIDITTSGANGLDVPTETASTWYFFYVIYNPATFTVAGLLSVSATSPTLPSGYTYFALVGSVYNNSSGNFASFYQQDRSVYFAPQTLFTAKSIGTTYVLISTLDTTTAIDTVIPITAKTLRGVIGNSINSCAVSIASSNTGIAEVTCNGGALITMNNFVACAPFEIPLMTQQDAYVKEDNTDAEARLVVTGYTF